MALRAGASCTEGMIRYTAGTSTKSLEGDSVADASETVGVNGCHREDGRSRETVL